MPYRRDIGNSLVFLGLILMFFVGYHTWVSPNTLPPTAPEFSSEEESTTGISQPTPSKRPAPLVQEEAPPPSPQARPVPMGEAPESTHSERLMAIRHLIEQKHAADAEATLGALSEDILKDPTLKPYVAILWNNLGVLMRDLRGPSQAVKAYKTGLAFNPNHPSLNLNLAHAYWETKDPSLTEEFLRRLAALVPDDPFPHIALADRLYGEDKLAEASRHLEMAAERAQAQPGLQAYLRVITAKVNGTEQIEHPLVARKSRHFVVKFEGGGDFVLWDEVLRILENAYREIGQALGYFPSQPIQVVLLTREQFYSTAGTPAWADALFDPVLGRIKVPTQGALTDKVWLAQVLRHEFVHALIHERMGVEAMKVPTWLNEGLAMQLAGGIWPTLDDMARGSNLRLIPLPALEKGWGFLSMEAATMAYVEANSATKYLIDRWGMEKVRRILSRIKKGDTIGGALHDKIMISYDDFEQRWKRTLHRELASGPRAQSKANGKRKN